MRKWTDEHGRLQLYDHISNRMVFADNNHKLCPFTLGYCATLDQVPGICFKDACEIWDPVMNRCSLSDRVRVDELDEER